MSPFTSPVNLVCLVKPTGGAVCMLSFQLKTKQGAAKPAFECPALNDIASRYAHMYLSRLSGGVQSSGGSSPASLALDMRRPSSPFLLLSPHLIP